jgi:hypothetical protein
MDSNAMLKRIRQYADLAARGIDKSRNERALRWEFDNLDHYLSNGGLLPEAWERDTQR